MRHGPRGRLLTRLLAGTLVPTVLALGGFGLLAHEVARRLLEDELGRRLGLAAVATAGMILPEQVAALSDGDTASLTHANVQRKLALARDRFAVRRVLLVIEDPTTHELTGLGDTAGVVAVGARAHELGADRLELAGAAGGRPAASPLFVGHDGVPYKRGYAAVSAGAGVGPSASASPSAAAPALGFAVVEASADYIGPLAAFRRRLVGGGLVALALVLVVTVVMARRVSGPVVRLAEAAARIGRGDLDAPMPALAARDEVGFLGRTLDDMRMALKARDERLQMMLAGIAHEVRNPLGGLELYAGLLRDALGDRPERLEEVRRIEREVHYLKAVVTEFLEYARRPPPELTVVSLPDLFGEIQELAAGSPEMPLPAAQPGSAGAGAGAVTATIEVDAPPGLAARADAGQLRRAVLNLARNAAAAATRARTDGTARVVLRARAVGADDHDAAAPNGDTRAGDRHGPRVRVEIDDNGAGVDPALREKIFAPFFTTREKGTGLGLAFVREIVSDHGSDVHVEAAPGGGARFWFDLPAAVRKDMTS